MSSVAMSRGTNVVETDDAARKRLEPLRGGDARTGTRRQSRTPSISTLKAEPVLADS
jgi:hypothetical protein